jgi:hypothetical protein
MMQVRVVTARLWRYPGRHVAALPHGRTTGLDLLVHRLPALLTLATSAVLCPIVRGDRRVGRGYTQAPEPHRQHHPGTTWHAPPPPLTSQEVGEG